MLKTLSELYLKFIPIATNLPTLQERIQNK